VLVHPLHVADSQRRLSGLFPSLPHTERCNEMNTVRQREPLGGGVYAWRRRIAAGDEVRTAERALASAACPAVACERYEAHPQTKSPARHAPMSAATASGDKGVSAEKRER
jgi:hypothetical protein